jgi:hypothetical protein
MIRQWSGLAVVAAVVAGVYAQGQFISLGSPIGMAAELVTSQSLSDWEQKDWAGDPARAKGMGDKVDHPIKCNDTDGWTADDNLNPTTTVTPAPKVAGAPAPHDRSLKEEGPYLKTKKENWKIFEMSIEYKALDAKQVPPLAIKKNVCTDLDPRPANNQHWSNSGVYIFDRYEVQIVDPSKFSGNARGAAIKNADGVSSLSQLLPGGLYEMNPPGGQFINRANPTNQWNTLVIQFCPAVLNGAAAKIRTALNPTPQAPNIVWEGPIESAKQMALPGTGGRGKAGLPFAYEGPIFLQSHWGSQVQFRNPVIKELKDCPL